MTCKNCGAKLKSRRRYFREITKRPFRICDTCERAQPHSLEFSPPAGANIDEATLLYEQFRTLFDRVSLRILVWGPDPESDSPMAKKRREIRADLQVLGHKVFFSEELIFDETYKVPANFQERMQLERMDAVICLASDFGPLLELQEFGLHARNFLGWLSEKARHRYTDAGIGQELRLAGRAPVFFAEEDMETCVIAAASAEWVEGHRMHILLLEEEQKRLARIAKLSRGSE